MNWFIQILCILAAGSAPRFECTEVMSTETLTGDLKCPTTWTPCEHPEKIFCSHRGLCCTKSNISLCVCQKCFVGVFCEKRNPFCRTDRSAPRLERTEAVSIETMTENLKCPTTSTPCEHPEKIFCQHHGICCRKSNEYFCRCQKCFVGFLCQKKKPFCSTSELEAAGSAARLERTEANSIEMLIEDPKCPLTSIPCEHPYDENFCDNHGICCRDSITHFCKCQKCFRGVRCEKSIPSCRTGGLEAAGSAPRLERTEEISIETLTEHLKCPLTTKPCGHPDESFCHHHGICCRDSNDYFCVCDECYAGKYCEIKKKRRRFCSSSEFEGVQVMVAGRELEEVQVMAVLNSVLGILLVCSLVAAVFLMIKYYRNRKNRCQDDQEIKKSLLGSLEFGEDEDLSKMMMTQPEQHHWKQNVRLITHDSSKMKSSPWPDSFQGNLLEFQWTEHSAKKANQTNTNEA